jgi:arylsulfatase A
MKKNIIIILEDDIGYEVPTYTAGSRTAQPQMDFLAKKECSSHLLFKRHVFAFAGDVAYGKYGFRNYHNWGSLDTTQKTIANMLHDNGYATCITGSGN